MANEQNLKNINDTFNTRVTHEELIENASKAGQASAEARKEKKMLRDLLEEALEKQTDTGNKYIDITIALIKEAEKGNVKAYETIRDTLGQKPKDNIQVGVSYEDYIKKVEDENEY